MFDLVLKLAENYQQKQELALLELQNEMNVKAEKNTEQTFNLWRSSIHDYKHKVLVIKHWLDEGKIEELKDLEKEIENIKIRNARVELDTKWETCWTRKICICVLTYIEVMLTPQMERMTPNAA